MDHVTEHAILLEVREGGAILVLLDQRQLSVFPADIPKTKGWDAPRAVYLRHIPLHGIEVVDIEGHDAASAGWMD